MVNSTGNSRILPGIENEFETSIIYNNLKNRYICKNVQNEKHCAGRCFHSVGGSHRDLSRVMVLIVMLEAFGELSVMELLT